MSQNFDMTQQDSRNVKVYVSHNTFWRLGLVNTTVVKFS